MRASTSARIFPRVSLLFSTVLLCLSVSAPAVAAVTLPSLFGDHMVVQRNIAVPVWGTATANESITVKLGTQQATATAGADGKWTVHLPAQDAGGPFSMTVTGSSTVTIADVYVGEVWVGSGQSNMGYTVHCTYGAPCGLTNEAQEIAAANYPLIRSWTAPWNPSAKPLDASSLKASWVVTSPQTVANVSAAGYFFARELSKALPNVAIGLVISSFGASCMQCWMSQDSLAAIPSVATLLAQFQANPNYTNQHNPYICYNGMIAPLIPYAIHGVIWYQGESVTWGGDTYRDLQIGLITSWRKAWGQDFTFLVVQLPNYNISSSGWPVLREAQLQATQVVPNTGLAVTIDIGDPTYVHPPDKQDVGLRLGLLAESITYGQNVADYGPLYDHMAVEGSSIRLSFTHTDAGIAFNGSTATGFEIAGADGNYVTATAAIQPDSTILVSATSVTAPKNARYCWAGNPTASLFSKGTPALPASPFRTDAPALPPPVTGGPDAGVAGTDGGAVVAKDASVTSGDAAVVFKDSGVPPTGGSGGNSGAGGNSGQGGNSGAGGSGRPGGTTVLGGNPGSGGSIASGGSPGSGGSKAGSGGAAASGGIASSGGTLGSGGSASTGGSTGAGGIASSAGNSGGTTGANTAASTAGTGPGGSTGGCSCRMGGRSSGWSDMALFAVGAVLVLGARRNRRKQGS